MAYSASLSECKLGRGCIVGSEVHLSKKNVPDGQRIFYPNRQRPNDMFDEEKHREVIQGLYEAISLVAPKPKR
jgi:carbonic anhydrase/acetyltransferase-like protein (isoleucine patch superfamily)